MKDYGECGSSEYHFVCECIVQLRTYTSVFQEKTGDLEKLKKELQRQVEINNKLLTESKSVECLLIT